jgi:hypothetical protein
MLQFGRLGEPYLGSLSKCSVKVGIGTDQVQVLRDARLVGAGRRIQSNTNNKCERQNLESRNPDRTNASAGLLDMAVALYLLCILETDVFEA